MNLGHQNHLLISFAPDEQRLKVALQRLWLKVCIPVLSRYCKDARRYNIVASMAPYGGTIHTPSLTLCKEKLSYLTCATGRVQVFDSKTILNLGEFISPSRTHTEKPRHLQHSPKHQNPTFFFWKKSNNERRIFPGFPAGRPAHTVRTMTESPSSTQPVAMWEMQPTQVCQIRSLSSKWTYSWEAIHIHWLYYNIHIRCICILYTS